LKNLQFVFFKAFKRLPLKFRPCSVSTPSSEMRILQTCTEVSTSNLKKLSDKLQRLNRPSITGMAHCGHEGPGAGVCSRRCLLVPD